MAGSTVIDSLVVEFGLDPTKFTQGQKQVVNQIKNSTQAAVKGGQEVENSAKLVQQALAGVRLQGIAVGALFGKDAGFAMLDFATKTIGAASSVGRLERNIGVSATTISKWQGLARIFGGDAQGMATSFKSLSDAFAGWKNGQTSPLIADLRAISAAGGKTIDVSKGVEQAMLDLADNLKAIHDKDPATAGWLQTKLGLDPAIFDALLQGGTKLRDMLSQIKGLTKDEADEATRLDQAWAGMVLKAERFGMKSVFAVNSAIDKWNAFTLRIGTAIQNKLTFGNMAGEKTEKDDTFVSPYDGRTYKRTSKAPESPSAAAAAAPVVSSNPAASGSGAFKSKEEKEAFIRQEAAARRIHPDVAMFVSKKEGFNNFQSTVVRADGSREPSWGAFQLYTGGGLGNEFQKKTGLDPRDPANERETIKFALDDVTKNGWTAFHGAANNGVGKWDGVDRSPRVQPAQPGFLPRGSDAPWQGAAPTAAASNSQSSNVTTNTTNITGPITVQTAPGADGHRMAEDFKTSIQSRQNETSLFNSGQN